MVMFRLVTENSNSLKKIRLIFFGFTVCSIEKSFNQKKIKLFNKITIKTKNYTNFPFYDIHFKSFSSFAEKLLKMSKQEARSVLLYVDHGLSGGTSSYSKNKFKEYKNNYLIVRLQYFHLYDTFVLSLPNGELYTGFTSSFDEIKCLLKDISFSKIVLNSLVSYRNILETLNFVHDLCINNSDLNVIYNVHDFFFICPNCNLVNSDNKFCGFTKKNDCSYCIQQYKSRLPDYENELFYGEFKVISQWRNMWKTTLLRDVADVICFSKSSCDLVKSFYPEISEKLRLTPHYVRPLKSVVIKPHNSINIAVLGKVDTVPKGKEIIDNLSGAVEKYNSFITDLKDKNNGMSSLESNDNAFFSRTDNNRLKKVNLFCIGDYQNPTQNMTVLGAYKRRELPEIIEKINIDLIFISSIWAETFSYTTSEAIAMNVPVACFNLGGQSDQVSVYSKGLILELTENADVVLQKMLDFLSSKV